MSELRFSEKRGLTGLRITVIILLALVVMAAAVCAALFLGKSETPPANVSDASVRQVDFELDPGTVYEHAVTDNKMFFFSVDNVKIASMSGALEQNLSLKISKPLISTDGSYALIADKGGKTAHIFSGSKLEKTLTMEENIIIAKINSSGYSLFITEGTIHKCSVIVRSSTGEEIFKWNSGSKSVVAADLSDNNRDIAVTTVGTDGGIITSDIFMFNMTKDKPFTNDAYSDEIYSVLRFDGNYLYCLGSAQTLIYNGYGKCIATIDYEDRELMNYDIDNGTVALVFSDSSVYANGSMVCAYGAKGAEQGQFAIDSEVSFIDCKDGSIAVDNNRVVSILDAKCRERFQLNIGTALRDFIYIGGTSGAVGITATGAEIINVKK